MFELMYNIYDTLSPTQQFLSTLAHSCLLRSILSRCCLPLSALIRSCLLLPALAHSCPLLSALTYSRPLLSFFNLHPALAPWSLLLPLPPLLLSCSWSLPINLNLNHLGSTIGACYIRQSQFTMKVFTFSDNFQMVIYLRYFFTSCSSLIFLCINSNVYKISIFKGLS